MQTAVPTDQTANHALEACERMLRPIMRLALDRGLKYQDIDELIRDLMLDEAAREWSKRNGKEPSGSQLSVTTGINRKEVKKRLQPDQVLPRSHESLASQVFTRWLAFVEEGSAARVLPKLQQTEGQSFESVAKSVGRDVHFRSVLDELVRLGLVRESPESVDLVADAFVPRGADAAMLSLLSDNAAAHMSAGVANVTDTGAPPFLEQSMWAGGIPEHDAKAIHQKARDMWLQARAEMIPFFKSAAEKERVEAPHRIRVGVYVYSEPMPDEQGESK